MAVLTGDLRNAVELFARSLKSTEVVKRFLQAQHCFETDAELTQAREVFNQAVQSFQEKQAAGVLSEQEIDRVRALQSNVDLHPRTVELLRAQQEMAGLLRDCNQQMTEVLGIDFAAIGVPAGCC